MSLSNMKSEPIRGSATPTGKRVRHLAGRTFGLLALALALLLAPRAWAFPPAPHHLIFGMVRDELGNPLAAENAVLVFETVTGVKLTTVVMAKGEPGQNYQLQVPMDSGVTSDTYMPTAMHPTAPFKIRVRIGDVIYLPIEMTGDYAVLGQPGKQTRINLTLGVDSDGDGLPDAWERALISASGRNLTLADIKPGDDWDGDGMTNAAEYLAGTYAWDKKDGFSLSIVESTETGSVLEFLAIRGRSYAIQSSSDLRNWKTTPFRLVSDGLDGGPVTVYQALDVRTVRVEVESEEDPKAGLFFKLVIQ